MMRLGWRAIGIPLKTEHGSMKNSVMDTFCADNPRKVDSGIEAFFSDDSVVLKNRHPTVGYVLFSKAAHRINYIFVNPRFRRQGFGWLLVDLAQRECGAKLLPAEPISPLGRKFFARLGSPAVSLDRWQTFELSLPR